MLLLFKLGSVGTVRIHGGQHVRQVNIRGGRVGQFVHREAAEQAGRTRSGSHSHKGQEPRHGLITGRQD